MSKFRPRLARYNTVCCEQVAPVPVIPICAISCCLPRPICEVTPPPPYVPVVAVPLPILPPCNPPQSVIDKAPEEIKMACKSFGNYCFGLPDPPPGTILTNTTGVLPFGYLFCDGAEVSRTTYNALFLAIGTYYGDGDGSTTFTLPDITSDSETCVLSFIIKT